MYAIGNLPDHVVRTNHKNQSRWMVMAAPPSRLSIWDVVERIAVTSGCAALGTALVVTVLYVLRGV